MGKSLLSIDWDYFIFTPKGNRVSYAENRRTLVDLWYKRYLQSKERGNNLQKSFRLSLNVDHFWKDIQKVFDFERDVRVWVSDSHALSYDLAEKTNCNTVYLFDAHADLGYGGLSSLNFETNCANWLGKLLKDKLINEAKIIYSPFTTERPEYFKAIIDAYPVQYLSLDDLKAGIRVSAIHICRSGAWTPPWFDQQFRQFIHGLRLPYEINDCPPRKWDTQHISFSDQIKYMMA